MQKYPLSKKLDIEKAFTHFHLLHGIFLSGSLQARAESNFKRSCRLGEQVSVKLTTARCCGSYANYSFQCDSIRQRGPSFNDRARSRPLIDCTLIAKKNQIKKFKIKIIKNNSTHAHSHNSLSALPSRSVRRLSLFVPAGSCFSGYRELRTDIYFCNRISLQLGMIKSAFSETNEFARLSQSGISIAADIILTN